MAGESTKLGDKLEKECRAYIPVCHLRNMVASIQQDKKFKKENQVYYFFPVKEWGENEFNKYVKPGGFVKHPGAIQR